MRPIETVVRRFLPVLLALAAAPAWAAQGLVAVQSPYDAGTTMDRLEEQVEARNLKVFARIDHAAGAETVGQTLRPTELLIFGNPKAGTPLMACAQSFGIDLPVKALVWEDADGQVWLGWNDPAFLAQRHGVPECPPVEKLQGALRGLADAVVAP